MEEIDYFFCLPGNNFSGKFLNSWTQTVLYLNSLNLNIKYSFLYTPIVSETRNKLIGNLNLQHGQNLISSIPFNGKIKPKKVIFIDSDIAWSNEDIKILLNSDKDIICGAYPVDGFFYKGLNGGLSVIKNGRMLMPNEINFSEPYEVDSCGFGFIAINFQIFQEIPAPWFNSYYKNFTEHIESVGEDVDFCEKVKKIGYKIYCDPKINLGHEKTRVLYKDGQG